MLSPRFLGTDVPGYNSSTPEFNVPGGNFEGPLSLAARAQQDIARTFERVRQDQEKNTQAYIQSAASIADATKAYAVLDNVQQERSAQGFSNLAGAVAGLAQTYTRFQEQKAQAAAAKIAADRAAEDQAMQRQRFEWEAEDRDMKRFNAAALIGATEEAEKLMTIGPTILREEGGSTFYTEQRNRILQKYAPYMDANQLADLIRKLEDPRQKILEEQFQERKQFMEKAGAATQEQLIQKGLFYLNSRSGVFLKNARNPEEFNKHSKDYLSILQETASQLPPIAQQEFVARAYKELGQMVDLRQGAFIELNNSLINYQDYVREASLEYAKLRQQGTGYLPQYEANLGFLRKKFGITASDGFSNPYKADEVNSDILSRQKQFDDAARRNELDAVERTAVTRDEVVSLAYMFYSDPRQKEAFKRYLNNPQIKSAVSLAENIEKYDKLVADLNSKRSRFNEELVRLDKSDLTQWLSWVQSDAGDDVMRDLGIRSRLGGTIEDLIKRTQDLTKRDPRWMESVSAQITGQNPNDLTRFGGLATANPREDIRLSGDIKPEEIQYVRSKVQQLSGIIKSEIQKQSEALNNDPEYVRLRSELTAYKLLQPNQRAAQAKVAAGRVSQVLKRIQDTQIQQDARMKAGMQPQMNRGGTQPEYPFNLPQLKKLSMRGNTIITPFKPDADVAFTDDYKAPRPGRLHAGVDAGAAVGTPLVFYDHGTVDYVGWAGGYGKLVDIKTRDGKIHRFAHLDSWNVQVGQKISPGSFFARTGKTGTGTGPHLHWEIRSKGEGGFESSFDPIKHMATYYRNGTGKQVRNAQRNPTHVPLNSIRGRDGSYIADGMVNTKGGTYQVKYSLGAPYKQDYISPYLGDWRRSNKAYDNYGYAELAKDKRFAQEIAKTASHIGVPAMWLADVMAKEGKFDPGIKNYGGSGATGLIQFMPETASWLGTSVSALAQMDRIEQMKWVRKYFDKMGFSKKMKNIYALVGAIWAGNIDKPNRLDPSFARWSDGDTDFASYIKSLGQRAGRQYKPYGTKGTAIHLSRRSNCAVCQSIERSGSSFFPHEAS